MGPVYRIFTWVRLIENHGILVSEILQNIMGTAKINKTESFVAHFKALVPPVCTA